MNVVKIHSWNATQPDLNRPDRFILDLDPDPTLSWQMMADAATLAKVLLDEIGLKSLSVSAGGWMTGVGRFLTHRYSPARVDRCLAIAVIRPGAGGS